MQPKFTHQKSGLFFLKVLALAMIFISVNQFSFAQQGKLKAKQQAIQIQKKLVEAKQQMVKQSLWAANHPTSNNDFGIAAKNASNSPAHTQRIESVCQTYTGSLASGDLTMANRLTRPGVLGGSCSLAYTFPGPTAVAGGVFYDTYTYINTTGLTQCGTFTLTTTDLTNANIEHGIYNGSFDPNNIATNYMADPGLSTGTPQTAPLTFQANISAGQTIVLVVWSANASTAASGTASAYTVTIDFPICSSTPCSGTPAPGNTLSTATSVCPTVPFTLSLQNNPAVAGLTYQWQSASAIGGPYSPIAGATGSTYTTSITVATFYRCNVTCSGNTGTSNPIGITINPPSSCYCAAGSPDVTFEKISNVTYNTINNNSSSTGPYENFTNLSTTVVQQSSLPISVSISNAFTTDQVKVWIDFNQNGSFSDPGELVYTSAAGVGPDVGNITIPATSSLGPTRMRVRLYDGGFDPNPGPCGNTSFGQVEDYTVNITPCIQGVFTSQPGNANIQCGSNTSFTVVAAGSNLSYQWEYKTSAASTTWLPVTNTGIFSTSTTATLNLNTVPITYNGYQFRAVISGPCTALDFSSSATLTVTPLIATVSPSSATICIGSIQQLTITNITSAPTTTTFSSGTLSIPIPDGNGTGAGAGINNSIPVVLPPGAIITAVNCKVNVSGHTWDGDLCMVLKAAGNNSVLNLNYFLSGTGAGPSSPPGFVNTVFSSTGINPIGGATAPFTGTFKADGQVTAGAFGNAGPTGFIPTVSTFQNLMTGSGAGNWTLAIYDGFAGDVGTLTGWSLDITYVAPVFATGIWSPTSTLFLDAGATVPYTGTPVTTVYAKPTVSTNYSVVVTTATCVSSPTIVPVNVTNPIVGLSAVANKSACVNGNATFSVTTTSGGPLTYQWQVSIDGGVTFNNIATGGTGSSYTVTGATALMNQYRYRVNVTAAPCGSATSSVGILTVNPLPVVTLSSSQPQLTPGQSATLTASSVPAAFNATSYSWTYNGAAISGATGNSVTAGIDKLGTYIATVTDVNGCVNSSNAVVISGASSDRLWIYPNPTSGQFQVRLYNTGTPNERREISIINSAGVLVASREFSLTNANGPYLRMDFDMSRLSPGVYVVKVADHFSKKITSGLLVIER